VVCNTPGASTKSVVELTIGHLIASTRFVARADRTLRSGDWAKKHLRGSELGGKRLGLIGFGRIARGVAEMAHVFGMEVNAFDPYVSADQTDELDCLMHDDVDSLFGACTHISVHCNLSEDTHHLVNRERLAMMPDIGADGTACGSHIVNCARGGIVDESAVLDALDSGVLSSAALDVFEVEPAIGNLLLQHERFHGSPHIGAATLEAQNRVGTEMAGLLVAFFNDERPKSAIN
jgi:phosphoglycerate dehydrogenase-like enzyme